jgi:hypothetical protein
LNLTRRHTGEQRFDGGGDVRIEEAEVAVARLEQLVERKCAAHGECKSLFRKFFRDAALEFARDLRQFVGVHVGVVEQLRHGACVDVCAQRCCLCCAATAAEYQVDALFVRWTGR